MIIGFLGQPRSGKTLLMTYWLRQFYLAGYTVVSNYHLSFPFEPFDIDVIDHLINNEAFQKQYKNLSEYYKAERIVIGIDEITAQMDSRTAMKKENILLSYLLMQAGKRNITIAWTAQLPHAVDKRLRDLTEFITFAEKGKNRAGDIVGYSYKQIDMYHLTTKSFFLNLKEAAKIYPLYNTAEVVNPQRIRK